VEELVSNKRIMAGAIVGLVVLQGLGAGVAWLLRTGAADELHDARLVNTSLQSQLDRTPATPVVDIEPAPAKWRLLDGPDVAGTMQSVQGLADSAGLAVDTIRAVASSAVGKQGFQLTARGTPRQVCGFLATLEQQERLLVVESGRVLPATAGTIAIELGFVTFHQGGGQ
jgi:hypothetical protein